MPLSTTWMYVTVRSSPAPSRMRSVGQLRVHGARGVRRVHDRLLALEPLEEHRRVPGLDAVLVDLVRADDRVERSLVQGGVHLRLVGGPGLLHGGGQHLDGRV